MDIKTSKFSARYKDAPWFSKEANYQEKVTIVGLGGIGSNTLYNLTKSLPNIEYILVDFDRVEQHNIGTQFFRPSDINKPKVVAMNDICESFMPDINLKPVIDRFNESYYNPITITGLDNMTSRREVFDIWRQHDDRELLIDGRLRATFYEVLVITKGMEEAYEETLFNDSKVVGGLCTFKQTTHFAMLIGARITQIISNFLSNKYLKEEIYNVPFHVKEFGDPFTIDVIYKK